METQRRPAQLAATSSRPRPSGGSGRAMAATCCRRRTRRSKPITPPSTVVLDPRNRRAPSRPGKASCRREHMTNATFGIDMVGGVPGPGKVKVAVLGRIAHPGLRRGVVHPGRPWRRWTSPCPITRRLSEPRSGNGARASSSPKVVRPFAPGPTALQPGASLVVTSIGWTTTGPAWPRCQPALAFFACMWPALCQASACGHVAHVSPARLRTAGTRGPILKRS